MREKSSIWSSLTRKYNLTRTLRFELKPVLGASCNDFREQIKKDEKRAEDFKRVKNILTDFYSYYLEIQLPKIKNELKIKLFKDLEELKNLYFNLENLKREKKLNNGLDNLRKEFNKKLKNVKEEIYSNLENLPNYKILIKGDLLKFNNKKNKLNILKFYLEDKEEDKKLVESFSNWTTYFRGFFENMENIFSKKSINKSTSLIYRMIDDNFLIFIKNERKINEIKNIYENNKEFKKLFDENFNRLRNEFNNLNNNIFNYFLTENYFEYIFQEGIDFYNLLLGGIPEKNIKGINGILNEFSQKVKDNLIINNVEYNSKKLRGLKLKQLENQILSSKDKKIKIEELKNDYELISKLKDYYKEVSNKILVIKKIFGNIENYDLDKVYFKNNSNYLTKLSSNIFGGGKYWVLKNEILKKYFVYNILDKKKFEMTKTEESKFEKYLKKSFSVKDLNDIINWYYFNIEDDIAEKERLVSEKDLLLNYLKGFKRKKTEEELENNETNLDEVNILNEVKNNGEILEKEILSNLNSFSKTENHLKKNDNEKKVRIIKEYLDSVLELFHFIKILDSKEKEEGDFYEKYDEIINFFKEFNKFYNMIRNYVTKKDYKTDKFKLTFENYLLLEGWDINKEKDRLTFLFREFSTKLNGYKYYLGILRKDLDSAEKDKILRKLNEKVDYNNYFEKLQIKNIPKPRRMLPKVFFSKKGIKKYKCSDEILKIYRTKSFKENLSDLHKYLDYYINSLLNHEWKDYFEFNFKNPSDYKSYDEFINEIEKKSFLMKFIYIDKEYLFSLIKDKKIFLFQIYNKDFSEKKEKEENYNSNKNIHTLYWNELFSEENLKNNIFFLNGNGEIFFRPKSLNKKITHPKNIPIKNKLYNENNKDVYKKDKSIFSYDLIKNKRYTEDKILFHIPIIINYISEDKNNINDEVNQIIKENFEDINILSIDRGERNLLYYTLIDKRGRILKQGSWNLIKDKLGREVDYYNKIVNKEKDRKEARKNWKKIENIKELKEGYLSQIIYEIYNLLVKYNAVLVMEDLNLGFKRIRQGIERQIYQRFENQLISKLNYLVFKNINKNLPGGVLKGLQLTSKLEKKSAIGKQTGIIFYVPASYTSQIDPITGFINRIYPNYENINQVKKFIENFDEIIYIKDDDLFMFKFNYENFGLKGLKRKIWEIYTNGERIEKFIDENKNNHWNTRYINLTEEFKNLFNKNRVNYILGNIKDEILKREFKVDFYKKLIKLLRLTLQLRNTSNKNQDLGEQDYIISCVRYKEGNFFDSRKVKENEGPKDADANGAYNIGIKGLILLNRIKISNKNKIDNKIELKDYINFYINNFELEN